MEKKLERRDKKKREEKMEEGRIDILKPGSQRYSFHSNILRTQHFIFRRNVWVLIFVFKMKL